MFLPVNELIIKTQLTFFFILKRKSASEDETNAQIGVLIVQRQIQSVVFRKKKDS